MLFNKGLALGGAMLVVAIPAQSAALHAQSIEANELFGDAVGGGRATSNTVATSRAASNSRVVIVNRAPPATVAASGTSSSLQSILDLLFARLPAPVQVVPAPVAVAQPAPAPAPAPAPTPAPAPVVVEPVVEAPVAAAPVSEPTPIADVVDAVVDTVVEVVTTVVDTVVAAAEAVVDTVVSVVAPSVETAVDEPAVPLTRDTVLVASQPDPIALPAPAPAPETAPAPESDNVAAPTVAKVFTVSNPTELRAALTEARTLAGAEIRLNPGNYGDLVWNFRTYPLGRVYVVAATSTKPVFRSIQANSSTNMSFHGIKVTGGPGKLVQLNSSRNMSFTGGEISGLTEDGNPWDETATGLQVRFSTNVVVQDVRFSDVRAAIYTQRSSKVDIRYNRVVNVREGMNIVSTDDIMIRGNHFSNFYPRYDIGEHPDAMQLWTNGEVKGSNRVRIIENLISMGDKRAVQGVLAGCEAAGVRHKDWELARNVYFGSSPHGLSFNCVDGLKVWNNVIVAAPHADVNNSIRTATTSGGYLPRLRVRTSTAVQTWNNILMTPPSVDSVSKVTSWDNWDLVDAMRGGGIPWTDAFEGGRPTTEAPPLSAFITRDPSAVRTRNGGVLVAYTHGVRSMSRNAALAEVNALLAD